jgi:hypothetical protein
LDPNAFTTEAVVAFPVDVALIQQAEAKLGRKLPPDLRVRLHRNNGGGIQAANDEWQLFPVFDPTDRRRIARTTNHIVSETRSARERVAFPQDAIAIADNGGGDLLIVRAGSDEIEFWDHETGESWQIDVDWG